MNTTIRLHDPTDLSNIKRQRSLFKRTLHLTLPKPSEVAVLGVGRTIGILSRNGGKRRWGSVDGGFVPLEDGDRFRFRARNVLL